MVAGLVVEKFGKLVGLWSGSEVMKCGEALLTSFMNDLV